MKRDVVVWVDHRQAVIAAITADAEELRRVESGLEKHVRFSGRVEGAGEDARDRRFEGHLTQYLNEVVAALRGAESILILGPGEAKHELEKRLKDAGLGAQIAGVETADKMTDPQVAAKARERFRK